MVLEKEYLTKGVKEAQEWLEFTAKRLKTKEGRLIAKKIQKQRFGKWLEEIKNQIRKHHQIKPIDYR